MHTLAAFAGVRRLSGTLIVVSQQDRFFDAESPLARVVRCGGASRGHSVFNGLAALRATGAAPADWVLVHDAARCLITTQQIDALIDACLPDPVGGLLGLPLPDTLKSERSGRVAQTVDRRDKWLAQTPQMFRIAPLQNALAGILDTVTDESSAMEAAGFHPLLVKGSAQNFKLTYPEDFSLAQAVLLSRAGQFETE
jgi:2-C-methyl-D-erythritol 4-phosphate cytidylyltransferase